MTQAKASSADESREQVVLPRRLPRGIIELFVAVPLILWLGAGYLLDSENLVVIAGVAGSVILGAGILVEATVLARRRAYIYRDLSIPIPAEMARSIRWGGAPLQTPALVLTLFMAGMFALSGIDPAWTLRSPVFLGWLLMGLALIFVGGPLWIRHRAKLRDDEMRRLAEQQWLALDIPRKSDGRQYALWGEQAGRQVQIHADSYLRIAVLVQEFEGESIRVVTSTWGDRRRMRRAGPLISTGDPAFDRRFLSQSVPPERGLPFFEDAELRRELLLRQQLGRFYFVVGGNGMFITQDYPRADGEYIASMISLAVRLAKRWDGQERVDFADSE